MFYTLYVFITLTSNTWNDYWRAGASQPSRTTGTIFLYIIGERERANLVVRLARFFYIYVCILLASEASLPSRTNGTIFLYICLYIIYI